MNYLEIDVLSNGPLSISLHGEEFPQDWHLCLDGEPLYHIGTTCCTCTAIFKRLKNVDLPIAPEQLRYSLEKGVQTVSPDIVETVKNILPKGKFIVALLDIRPKLAQTRDYRNYVPSCFADYFWWQPIHSEEKENQKAIKSEIILPIFKEDLLDIERVDYYKNQLRNSFYPTALAFSLLDRRVPMGGEYTEWILAHFLLDGHHKVMAASQLNQSIRLLSFLLIDYRGFSVDINDDTIIQLYGKT